MQKRFAQKMEDMRRLIDDSRSAFVSVGGEGSLSVPRYLLAVSGGMDSMCMADLFLKTLGADCFSIAHCNFSLRGEESDGDEALVREWAGNNGVQLFVKHFDTELYARENGISIEMAARELRYGWFARLCQEHGFAALAVAHNANDNAETLLLNLLRGTGLKGLHGMSEVSFSHPRVGGGAHKVGGGQWRPLSARTYNENVTLYRPLLEFTRKQIEGYVFAHRVPYRHDSSNFSSDYKRNRIRNEVFPVFEKINPSFIRTLNREIGYFSEAEEIVSDWCRSMMPSVASGPSSVALSINISSLLKTPHWRYLLYYMLEPYGFSSQVLSSLEDLLISDRTLSGKRFESVTHILLTEREAMVVLPRGSAGSSDEGCGVSEDLMVVRGDGTYNFNGRRFRVETLPWSADMPYRQPEGVVVMDACKMAFPFVCRKWRRGDWYIPLGMRGRKKISDVFADLKYDSFAKEKAVVMVDCRGDLAENHHVAGLLSLRPDDRYKIDEHTEKIIRITELTAV